MEKIKAIDLQIGQLFRLEKDDWKILKRNIGKTKIINGNECIPVSSVLPPLKETFWMICKDKDKDEYVYPVTDHGHYVPHEGRA